jgi:hypothetical protein
MRAPDGPHARLGEAEVLDLSLGDQLFDGAGDVFDRDVGVDAVLVVEVDGLDAKPKLKPMQPRPRAETSRLLLPRWRFCIDFSFRPHGERARMILA